MILVLLVLLTACSASGGSPETVTQSKQPSPTIHAWHVLLAMGDGGTIEGYVSYIQDESSTVLNAHGLAPNALYPLHSFDLLVTPTYLSLPYTDLPSTIRFSNVDPAIKDELCIGVCILSQTQYDRLWFTDGQHTLQIDLFELVAGLPRQTSDWGHLEQSSSWLKRVSETGVFQYLIFLTDATIEEMV